jgi:transposase, IS30 family
VDRASRFLISRKVHVCAAEPVAQKLRQSLRRLPADKRRTLTLDNGREFARPIELAIRLQLEVFFAHPYHSWERGTNENTNGLLRQYLPKGADLSPVTPEQLRACVWQLNHRPRKCLDYRTPFEVFHPTWGSDRPSRVLTRTHRTGRLDLPLRRIGLCREATRAPQRPRDMGDVVSL